MPTCPLCESTQPLGEACDVCGRPFPASEAVPVAIPPLPGLEGTRYSELGAAAPVSRLPELEPTSDRGGAAPATSGVIEGFAPTAAEPVRVDVTPLEVERVGDDAVVELLPAAGPPVCRYCRTPATRGEHICPICGMRLPIDRPLPRTAGGATLCRDCGMEMTGTQCPACGARPGTLR